MSKFRRILHLMILLAILVRIPLKNHKATKLAFNAGPSFKCRYAGGRFWPVYIVAIPHHMDERSSHHCSRESSWVSQNILLEGLNQFHGANLALNSDVDQTTFRKVTKHSTHDRQEVSHFPAGDHKAARNRHDSTTHTNMKHNLQKRPTKKTPP